VTHDAQDQRIAELEQRNAELEQRNAELEQRNAELFEALSALRLEVARLSTALGEVREKNARLVAENRALRKRVGGKGGGGTSGGSDGKPTVESLREKAEKQRQGKARRKAARAAAELVPRGRGKRSKRPAFEADETTVIDVPVEELPADAKPNGYVDRGFYGVRLSRYNVRVRLREYVSPTQGRIVAKLPPGWTGDFTPELHTTVNSLSIGGMTETKIRELLADHGVKVSAGQINRILLMTADKLRDEQLAAHRAGVQNSPVVGIDGTHSTCDGDPRVCHIVGNEVFTTLTTTEHKDRVTVYGVLAGASVGHCVGEHALAHPDLGVAAREVLRRVHADEPVLAWADESLTELATKLRTEGLDAAEMDSFLQNAMPGASSETHRHMREATASEWLRSVLRFRPLVMLTDGGTNYHGVLAVLQLCWIHMLRPFSLLAEGTDSTRVLTEGWKLYSRIKAFREAPEPIEATSITAEFDHVFDPDRCGDDGVRRQVQTTRSHKDNLLTVLRYPFVPPENNGQERGAKARVRKRDISFGPRSERGLRAWDTMQSTVGTLRKLGISPTTFIADRITRANTIPPLDVLVADECLRRWGPMDAAPGTF
jgi:regulator of replication initiation timing